MPAGRPPEYSEEILTKALEYITDPQVNGDPIPTVEGLAIYLDVARDTIYDWERQEDKKDFSYIVNKLRTKKSNELQKGGLLKEFDGRIAALLLGHEGYRNQQDITTDGKQLPTPIYVPKEDD